MKIIKTIIREKVKKYVKILFKYVPTNVTNPRKRLNVQIEANGSEATYAGACMTIIASYGGNQI